LIFLAFASPVYTNNTTTPIIGTLFNTAAAQTCFAPAISPRLSGALSHELATLSPSAAKIAVSAKHGTISAAALQVR